MNINQKKSLFICQIAETLKVIKSSHRKKKTPTILALCVEAVAEDADTKKISEQLGRIFKKLKYNREPMIISLPRNLATLRYLKVPTQNPQEIENIVSLQASTCLPYPATELITAYQTISVDANGYSDINLIIVHHSVIERYLDIFNKLHIYNTSVILSSYGLVDFYYHSTKDPQEAAILIDIDYNQIELAICVNRELLLSRSFKLKPTDPHWQNTLVDEIYKTKDGYAKEIPGSAPKKIVLMGSEKLLPRYQEVLQKKIGLPVEIVSSTQQLSFSEQALATLKDSDYSFLSLIGLSLREITETLNLLPTAKKKEITSLRKRRELVRLTLFALITILVCTAAIVKDFNNKTKYILRLEGELSKISKEAKPLEEIEKHLKLLESRIQKKPTSLDVLYELYQIMPNEVLLVALSFEEDKEIILRGQTQALNPVFSLVSQLEKSDTFKTFTIKVRYATTKKTQTKEFVDFEIVCTRK